MTTQRRDWPRIIAELEQHVSLYKLAIMMDRQLVQLQRWKAGSEPRHQEGELLLLIHARYCSAGNVTPVTVPNAQAST